jgi:hypothetical protein
VDLKWLQVGVLLDLENLGTIVKAALWKEPTPSILEAGIEINID